jgi:hypothetical protein
LIGPRIGIVYFDGSTESSMTFGLSISLLTRPRVGPWNDIVLNTCRSIFRVEHEGSEPRPRMRKSNVASSASFAIAKQLSHPGNASVKR